MFIFKFTTNRDSALICILYIFIFILYLNCIYLYFLLYSFFLVLSVSTKILRVMSFQFSVCAVHVAKLTKQTLALDLNINDFVVYLA